MRHALLYRNISRPVLASPSRHAVRDLFDLGFGFRDFREQVLPFLSEECAALYPDERAFLRLRSSVEDVLLGLAA
jgi:hypothetical protein